MRVWTRPARGLNLLGPRATALTLTLSRSTGRGDRADKADPLASVTRRVTLRNGRPRAVRLSFLVPTELPAGSYFITTAVDTTNAIDESRDDNNTAISPTPYPAA